MVKKNVKEKRGPGRPRIGPTAAYVVVRTRLPDGEVEIVDAEAKRRGWSRALFIRVAIEMLAGIGRA